MKIEETMGYTDDIAVKELKNGSKEAYKWIYDTFFPQLCRFAEKKIEDEEVAKDIVQDLLMKIWEKRDVIEIKVSLKYYLFCSVHNACLKYLEHQKVILDYQNDFLYENEDAKDSFDPETIMIRKEMWDFFNKAIDALPDQYRTLITLVLEELSYKEIAERLSISEGSIGPLLIRAKKNLGKLLKMRI